MYGNVLDKVWVKLFNSIFQNEATIAFKYDIHQSFSARWALSFHYTSSLNAFGRFWEK